MVTMHEMEFNLNLLSPLGIKYLSKDRDLNIPDINIPDVEIDKNYQHFSEQLVKKNLDPAKKLIFIHPGMTGHTLNWSTRNYGRLILKLSQRFPEKFIYVISFTPSDNSYLDGVNEILNRDENKQVLKDVYFFNGAVNGLRYYMSILKKAALFIGPSTGTTHIAAVLGVPLVGIYSPIKIQSSKRWGPLAKNKERMKIIVPDVICGEAKTCSLKECPYYECMGKIEVEDVIKLAITVMDL
jgi:ADP-heptose:LPS heptosyltransferase